MMKGRAMLLVVLLGVMLATSYVVAAEPGGAGVESSTDKGEFPAPSPGSVSVESGNIYEVNISTNQSTYHWTGVYGNATGKLVLGDSSGDKMYEWTAVAKYVYFDDDSSINWGSLASVTCSDVEGVYGYLAGASDSCSNTFTATRNYDSDVTSDSVANAIAAQTYDDNGAAYWYTIAVGDGGTSDIVFVGETTGSSTHGAYNGVQANYQVILPEDGGDGDTTAATYYIWIELY